MNWALGSEAGFFGWLGRTSWQAALVIIVVLLVQSLFAKQLTPRWRHALWLLVVIRLAVPGSLGSPLSLFNVFNPPAIPTSATFAPVSVRSASHQQSQDTSDSGRHSSFGVRIALRGIWVIGAVTLATYFLFTAWQLGRKVRRQRPVTNEAVLNLLEDCKHEMGVFVPVTLIETPAISSPALLGFIRPRLLLPAGTIQSFSRSELRYIFLHEMGHLKRGDIIINWLVTLPLVLHWFNPLVWYAIHRIRLDGESACDAVALSHVSDGENQLYGQTIIKLLERFSSPMLAPALVGILARKTYMHRRIGVIARFRKSQRFPVFSAFLFAALALVTLTDAQTHQTPVAIQNRSNEVSHWRPWIISSSPRAGDSEVDSAITEIAITFDRDMGDGMSWADCNRPDYPPLREGQKPHWRDRRTCVLPVALEPNRFYRVGINTPPHENFRSLVGHPGSQSVLYFATRGASDEVKAKLTKPKIVSITPPNGATDVDPNLKEIRVTFDVPMGFGYSWCGGGDAYPGPGSGAIHWTLDFKTCVLPVSLQHNHQYDLWLNSEAAVNFQSANGGVPLEPVPYSFKTRP